MHHSQGEPVASARSAAATVKRIIARQMNRSGNTLLSATEPMSDERFYAGGVNGISPAWTIGHLACVTDLFTSWMLGRPTVHPKAAHAVFNPLDIVRSRDTTKAESVDPSSFSRDDIVFYFRTGQVEALRFLKRFEVSNWELPPLGGSPENLPTNGCIWEHLAIHTYWHLGELAGALPEFHGSYTLNMVPHYFFFQPSDDENGDDDA